MPTKTKRDEHKWERAKEIAEEAGKGEQWEYVMGIYKRMRPDYEFKSGPAAKKAARPSDDPRRVDQWGKKIEQKVRPKWKRTYRIKDGEVEVRHYPYDGGPFSPSHGEFYAWLGDRAIGYLQATQPPKAEAAGQVAFDIEVSPDFRRRGVGSALTKAVRDRFRLEPVPSSHAYPGSHEPTEDAQAMWQTLHKSASSADAQAAGQAFFDMARALRAAFNSTGRIKAKRPAYAYPRGTLPPALDEQLIKAYAEVVLPQYGRTARFVLRLNGPMHGWRPEAFAAHDIQPEDLKHYLVVTPTGFDDTATWKRFNDVAKAQGVDARANIPRTLPEVILTAKQVGKAYTELAMSGKVAGSISREAGWVERGRQATQRLADQWLDRLPGGLADQNVPADFDPAQLTLGIKVEMEHTDDPEMAREIAMDHLTEHPGYYTALHEMEQGLEKQPAAERVASRYLSRELD